MRSITHYLKQPLAAALLVLAAWPAQAEPPTDASLVQLMAVTRADAMMDTMYANVEQMIRQGMQAGAAGKTLTPAQARVLELAPGRLSAALREEITWARMQPLLLQVYRESLDQAEVDGLIAFYQSPLGQSYLNKMPLLMQRSMQVSQQLLQSFMPKLQGAMAAVMKEAQLSR